MTDQNELRDRIEQIIEDKTYAVAPDGFIAGTEDAAQAIIDEFRLTVEERIDEPGKRGINPVRRVVGKWEKQ